MDEYQLLTIFADLKIIVKFGALSMGWAKAKRRIFDLLHTAIIGGRYSVVQIRLIHINKQYLSAHTNFDLQYLHFGDYTLPDNTVISQSIIDSSDDCSTIDESLNVEQSQEVINKLSVRIPCASLGCSSICRSKLSFIDAVTVPRTIVFDKIAYLTNNQIILLFNHLYRIKEIRHSFIELLSYRISTSIDLYYGIWWYMKVNALEHELYKYLEKKDEWMLKVKKSHEITTKFQRILTEDNAKYQILFIHKDLISDLSYNIPFEPYGRITNITSKIDKITKFSIFEVRTTDKKYVYHPTLFKILYNHITVLNLVDSFSNKARLYLFEAYLCGHDSGYLSMPNNLVPLSSELPEEYSDGIISVIVMNLMFGIDMTQLLIDRERNHLYVVNYSAMFGSPYVKNQYFKLTNKMEEDIMSTCIDIRSQYYFIRTMLPEYEEKINERFAIKLPENKFIRKLKSILHPSLFSRFWWS